MATAQTTRPAITAVRYSNASRAANLGFVDMLFGAAYAALLFTALVRVLEVEALQGWAAQVAMVLSPIFSLVEALGVAGTGVVACMLAGAVLFALQQALNKLLRLLAGQPRVH